MYKPTTEIFYNQHEIEIYLFKNGFNHSDIKQKIKETLLTKRTGVLVCGNKKATINWTKNNRMIYSVTITECI